MNAISFCNRMRAEAQKLPEPTMHGERIVSPRGYAFQAVVAGGGDSARTISWEFCGYDWSPSGLTFRERVIAFPG